MNGSAAHVTLIDGIQPAFANAASLSDAELDGMSQADPTKSVAAPAVNRPVEKAAATAVLPNVLAQAKADPSFFEAVLAKLPKGQLGLVRGVDDGRGVLADYPTYALSVDAKGRLVSKRRNDEQQTFKQAVVAKHGAAYYNALRRELANRLRAELLRANAAGITQAVETSPSLNGVYNSATVADNAPAAVRTIPTGNLSLAAPVVKPAVKAPKLARGSASANTGNARPLPKVAVQQTISRAAAPVANKPSIAKGPTITPVDPAPKIARGIKPAKPTSSEQPLQPIQRIARGLPLDGAIMQSAAVYERENGRFPYQTVGIVLGLAMLGGAAVAAQRLHARTVGKGRAFLNNIRQAVWERPKAAALGLVNRFASQPEVTDMADRDVSISRGDTAASARQTIGKGATADDGILDLAGYELPASASPAKKALPTFRTLATAAIVSAIGGSSYWTGTPASAAQPIARSAPSRPHISMFAGQDNRWRTGMRIGL